MKCSRRRGPRAAVVMLGSVLFAACGGEIGMSSEELRHRLRDAGAAPDASATADAGLVRDAGSAADAAAPAPDAAAPDATAPDATAVADAGFAADAAAPDATTIADAGVRDASAPDAAAPDAATIADAGVPDASAPDASTLADAGSAADSGVWRPFAANSPWNTPIPANPTLDPDSTNMVNLLANSSQWPGLSIAITQYSVPIYYVDSSVAPVFVQVNRVAGEGFHTDPHAPIPAGAAPAAGTDAHLCLVDRARNLEWDFWRAANTNGAWTCEVCAQASTSGSGVRPHPQQTLPGTWYLAHGARACGFPLTAGLIKPDEIQAGRIEHALVIGYPGIRSRYYKDPASTAQATLPQISPTVGIPCGGRVQLDPSIDVTTLGLSRSGVIIARALQEYGAYVGDYNGSIALYADASPTAQAAWSGVLRGNEVQSHIDLHNLRVLELGPLYDDGN